MIFSYTQLKKGLFKMNLLTKKQWIQKKRRKKYFRLILRTSLSMVILSVLIIIFSASFKDLACSVLGLSRSTKTIGGPEITEMLLTPNVYSRPQTPLRNVNSVVIHYTANPGTSAEANRNYFESLRIKKTTSSSSHFVIGLEGEIIECIPLDEISYASNDRNFDTISIECCHPDESGEFNDETYKSLVVLIAWICCKYNLDKEDIIRHYDVSGKKCPLYYVDHEDKWEDLKDDVMNYIDENAVIQ